MSLAMLTTIPLEACNKRPGKGRPTHRELELEAEKSTMLLELHNVPVANIIGETMVKLVELKSRIARAEDRLRMELQEIQKMIAVLQVVDLIAKQHTATTVQTGTTSTPPL